MPEVKRRRAPGREASPEPALEAAFRLVASLPVPVFFKSRDGRYLGVNRAWEDFFGVRGAEFVGSKVADLYPQDPAVAERHARMQGFEQLLRASTYFIDTTVELAEELELQVHNLRLAGLPFGIRFQLRKHRCNRRERER